MTVRIFTQELKTDRNTIAQGALDGLIAEIDKARREGGGLLHVDEVVCDLLRDAGCVRGEIPQLDQLANYIRSRGQFVPVNEMPAISLIAAGRWILEVWRDIPRKEAG